ncbi:Coatomer beta subunit [Parasponia andersonii]|uniref:Coatomer beta subunit n=1 Tax=Parasponia andersonii TaxID=3476 RepID=A0A2P5B5D8_PARAD|nr:Coatomer beta subunit [Parasponia andersonii]
MAGRRRRRLVGICLIRRRGGGMQLRPLEDLGDATPGVGRRNRWDETPTPGRVVDFDTTPAGAVTPGATPSGMTWDATPKLSGLATPTPKKQRSRWDETPATMGSATPMAGATPAAAHTTGVTLAGGAELATPTPGAINLRGSITPEQYNLLRWENDIEERNRPLTAEELDAMFPEGYKILDPPASYVPIRTPARKLLATPTRMGTPLYAIPEENRAQQFDVPKEASGGLFMKPEDYLYFGALWNEEDEEELFPDEQKERKIMKLLLKVKNGTPPLRKTALRQLLIKVGVLELRWVLDLLEILEHGLNDENQKVRTITVLSLAALAEASAPYGIESFDSVLKPLWKGIRSHRGKVLAAFLKTISSFR